MVLGFDKPTHIELCATPQDELYDDVGMQNAFGPVNIEAGLGLRLILSTQPTLNVCVG